MFHKRLFRMVEIFIEYKVSVDLRDKFSATTLRLLIDTLRKCWIEKTDCRTKYTVLWGDLTIDCSSVPYWWIQEMNTLSPLSLNAHYEQSTISTPGLNCDKLLYEAFEKKPAREREQGKLKKPVGTSSRCFTPKRVNSICRAWNWFKAFWWGKEWKERGRNI